MSFDGRKDRDRILFQTTLSHLRETGYHRRDGELAELKALVEKAGIGE